jgi:hypothetical protein
MPDGCLGLEEIEEDGPDETVSNELTTSASGTGPNVPAQPSAENVSTIRSFAESYRASAGPIDFRFLPQPPSESRMFHSSGPRGRSFTIRLEFTGILRPGQNYRV